MVTHVGPWLPWSEAKLLHRKHGTRERLDGYGDRLKKELLEINASVMADGPDWE